MEGDNEVIIHAVSEDGSKNWSLTPKIINSEKGYILVLLGQVRYYVQDIIDRPLKTEWFCIDAGGRNFGVDCPVYVKTSDVFRYIEKEMGVKIER